MSYNIDTWKTKKLKLEIPVDSLCAKPDTDKDDPLDGLSVFMRSELGEIKGHICSRMTLYRWLDYFAAQGLVRKVSHGLWAKA